MKVLKLDRQHVDDIQPAVGNEAFRAPCRAVAVNAGDLESASTDGRAAWRCTLFIRIICQIRWSYAAVVRCFEVVGRKVVAGLSRRGEEGRGA